MHSFDPRKVRLFLRGAAGAAMIVSLAACGGNGGPTSTNTGAAAPTPAPTSMSTIGLSAASYSVAQSSSAVVTIDRVGSPNGVVGVAYTTADGSALAGTDYTATAGTVSWPDGDASPKSVSVPVAASAAGKSFSFKLTAVTGQAQLGAATAATVGVSSGTVKPAALAVSIQGGRFVDANGHTLQLRGVNVSGLESGVIYSGGTNFWQSSGLPGRPDFTKIAAWKANAVRLPLNEDSWLGLTVTGIPGNTIVLNGPAYRAEVAATVAAANAAGLYVILDLHWTAPATFAANAQNPFMNADNSLNFWTAVASAFKGNPAVMFELFNEPYVCPASQGGRCSAPENVNANQLIATGGTEDYYIGSNNGSYGGTEQRVAHTYATVGYQQVIDAVRATGATNVIICGGNNYSDDLTWWAQYPVTDPLNQVAAALHQYPGGYPYDAAAGPTKVNAMLAPIVTSHPIILTELGDEVGANPAPFASAVLAWADAQGYSVMAWTWNPWGGANTLIQNATTYAPTAGLGQTYHDWLVNHP